MLLVSLSSRPGLELTDNCPGGAAVNVFTYLVKATHRNGRLPPMDLQPTPRVVDALLIGITGVVLATGLASLLAGRPELGWVVISHGIAGILLTVVLVAKLRRVAPRLNPDHWEYRTIASVLTLVITLTALGTGFGWVHGVSMPVGQWSLLTIHGILGVSLLVPILWHLKHRFHLPSSDSVRERRTALQSLVLVGGGILAWQLQQRVLELVQLATADRRFTGSREVGADAGNSFPVTSWVADDPNPIDADEWTLTITGAVRAPQQFQYEAVSTRDALQATLDCTGGWYTVQEWQGIRVGKLLEAVDPVTEANWVRFESITGYRWNLPIDEAREALLATHVGGQQLSHGHGFPLRLVAPGRRGFQWVKWVTRIEIRTEPDYGQWVVIFTSGFGSNE